MPCNIKNAVGFMGTESFDSDMISLLFTVGYMVIRLIGTLVPKVNYFLNTTLEINP